MGCQKSCQYILRFVYFIPVLFLWTIILWSYFAYVVALCIEYLDNLLLKIIYIFFYNVTFGLFMLAYYRTIWTPHSPIPNIFYLSSDQFRDVTAFSFRSQEYRDLLWRIAAQKQLPLLTCDAFGAPRICASCRCFKPDRAHHCSTCGRCILKMDHHCPWVDNCVGFSNYKFFVQFLLYGLLFCTYVWVTTLPHFIDIFTKHGQIFDNHRFHIVMAFFIAIVFSIALLCLGGYHLYLVAVNKTTLESVRPILFVNPNPSAFHLGVANNFQEVFGLQLLDCFWPKSTQLGDGIVFPTKRRTRMEEISLRTKDDHHQRRSLYDANDMENGLQTPLLDSEES